MERLTCRRNDDGFINANVLLRGKRFGPAFFPDKEDYQDYSAALDRLAQYEDAEEQGRMVGLPEPTPDIDYMRIFNLIMADAEDRVSVLPCKVGDMVYYLRGLDILGDTVERIILDGIDNQVLVGAHKAFMFCDFGRNVFLTRREAESSQKGGANVRTM